MSRRVASSSVRVVCLQINCSVNVGEMRRDASVCVLLHKALPFKVTEHRKEDNKVLRKQNYCSSFHRFSSNLFLAFYFQFMHMFEERRNPNFKVCLVFLNAGIHFPHMLSVLNQRKSSVQFWGFTQIHPSL